MIRFGFFSALLVVGAIAGAAEVTPAQCFRNSNSTLNRSAAPEDTSFVRSSPANSDSNFTLQLDLNNGLDFLETEPEEEEMTTEATIEAEAATAEASVETNESAAASDPAEGTAHASEMETTSSSSAADLDTIDLQAQIEMSREDYLNSRASDINSCAD